MTEFKVGDVIRVRATVVGVNTPFHWVNAQTAGGSVICVGTDGIELVERPKSAGQRAYEAWAEGWGHVDWASITTEYRKRWERAAGAV